MNKKLVLDLLILHVVAIGILLLGNAMGSRGISSFLLAEVAWLVLFTYLAVKSKARGSLILLSLPIFWMVERQLILVVAMSAPYIVERFFTQH